MKMRRARTVGIGILLCWVSVIICSCFGIAGAEQAIWDCSECGRTGNTKNYCGGCGYPAPWIEDASGKLSQEKFSKVGNIVRYGHYEQDNDLNNGKEEIEWVVLAVLDRKSLLISKYGLDARPYNLSFKAIKWETCSLRRWLNNDFFKTAFTLKEQSAITLRWWITVKVMDTAGIVLTMGIIPRIRSFC